jgi:hypothetical protein
MLHGGESRGRKGLFRSTQADRQEGMNNPEWVSRAVAQVRGLPDRFENAGRSPVEVVRAIAARASSFRTAPCSGVDRAIGPLLLPRIR